jgi:two-component system sensor histidine kinase ArlS
MKIQSKLILIFSFLFGLILLLFIVGVYHYYTDEVHDEFFNRLHLQAAVKVDLIDGGTVDKDVLHAIYANSTNKIEPWVTIYTDEEQLVYRDKEAVLPAKMQKELYNKIKQEGQYETWYGSNQLYGMLIQGEKDYYVATAMGYDFRGMSQLKSLRVGLAVAYLIAMLFIILTVRLFTKQAFTPVARMTKKVSDITGAHLLDIRLDEGNKKDELAHLAITFNNMLAQLKSALQTQKQLVYNISHELRTPLSAIVTELELARESAQTKEDYETAVDKVLADSHRLVKLSNDLLDMAKANYGLSEIATHLVRIDEILLEACRREQKANEKYKVQINFEEEDISDDRLVSLHGNEYLLGVAFGNLIDNACKFSPDKRCLVHISFDNVCITIRVEDFGIGIKESEYQSIFEPFYRGDNKSFVDGNGIGLSLVKKIIEIHGGDIGVESQPGHTVFTVHLHNLMND